MSLAWSGLLLLVLLLPGFLFYTGLYFPEKFTRETTERSPLGQVAAALLVSFVVHGSLFAMLSHVCGSRLPCIDLRLFLTAVNTQEWSPEATNELAAALTATRWWVLGYVLTASGLGAAGGGLVGWGIVKGRLRFLAQHTWIYDLTVDRSEQVTVAYVMTTVRHMDRVLLYRGFLKAFGLQRDGRFAYLVLKDVVRYYMLLGEQPRTTPKETWIAIGETSGSRRLQSGIGSGTRDRSYLFIEGGDVSNVVFDRHTMDFTSVGLKRLRAIVEEAKGGGGAPSTRPSPGRSTGSSPARGPA